MRINAPPQAMRSYNLDSPRPRPFRGAGQHPLNGPQQPFGVLVGGDNVVWKPRYRDGSEPGYSGRYFATEMQSPATLHECGGPQWVEEFLEAYDAFLCNMGVEDLSVWSTVYCASCGKRLDVHLVSDIEEEE